MSVAAPEERKLADRTRVVLTSRDHAILCGIAVQGIHSQAAYLGLLSEKLDATLVGRAGDLPLGTVHLGSRVRYRVDNGKLLEHTLVIGSQNEIAGTTCSLRSLYGLALLGMREGEAKSLPVAGGGSVEIAVDHVEP